MSDAIGYVLRNGKSIYYKDAKAREYLSTIVHSKEAESGQYIAFEYGDDKYPAKPMLSSIKIRMNPKVVGEGTPSEANIFQISKWNSVSLGVSHRNVVPSWITYIENEFISDKGDVTTNNNYRRIDNYIPVEPNTIYYCSCDSSGTGGAVTVPFYDENFTFLNRAVPLIEGKTGRLSGSFTTPENAKYIRFSISKYKSNLEISKEENDSNKSEIGVKHTFTFTDAQNVYGAELSYLGSKQWMLKATHAGKILDGTEGIAATGNPSGWSVSGTADGSNLIFNLPLTAKPDPTDRGCSHYPNEIVAVQNTLKGFYVYYDKDTAPNGMLCIRNHFADPAYTDNDDDHLIMYFEEYLDAQKKAGTPVTCYWKLLEPKVYILSEDEIELYTGLNMLSTSDGYIESLEYRTDLDPDDRLYDRVLGRLGSAIAPIEKGSVASRAYAKNDYLIFDNKLCKCSKAISVGATLAIGTNLTQTTIVAELKAIIGQL